MTIDIVGMEQNGKTIFDQREDVTFVLGEGADMNIPMGLELALEKIKKNEKVQILIRFKLYFGFYALFSEVNESFFQTYCFDKFYRLMLHYLRPMDLVAQVVHNLGFLVQWMEV